ncbi:DUF6415 family natural product biosynthesis protein [Streptomyces spinosirectus]
MAHRRTELAQQETEEDPRPPDIVTMRASTARALADAPSSDDLDTLAALLRSHMRVLIPEVEKLAARRNDTAGISARACIGEAYRKLQIGNGDIEAVRVSVVQKLARSVNALCDHYERLGGEL